MQTIDLTIRRHISLTFGFPVLLLLLILSGIVNPVFANETLAQKLESANLANAAGEYSLALALYTPLAEQGSADAMLALGIIHGNGWGTEQNTTLSEEWMTRARMAWEQAAKNGDPRAYASLGIMHKAGLGMIASPIMAKRYFSRAARLARPQADAGDPDAQYLLGSLYLGGRGVEKDRFKSVEWLEKAAESGQRKAMGLLVHIFACNCKGFPPDPDRTEQWRQLLATY